ncbi:CHAT domain-containing protein [Paraburkholderia sp. CNPSo 3274]|uniref:CHAT domain-containing protein n=1 Tax=Paraburkholderia sp. CNPSo 3274 TaxID=2940932 RepID=UPI0020B6ABFD|nr:CHAT domain-containing protein [Paraburkholderia sp. CNPSo 3274]MCP3705439.1 CHAT domain-containing protein [Paraburkholderia sp. CNPSo 3274]
MRKITLELLRQGPSHNQLLSPLTAYIALCENHSAVTLHVPFEHNQMLYRLRALSYQLGAEAREFQLGDTALVLGKLLGEIPGLTADLNRRGVDSATGDEPVTHLRLILSASELALLPFELATAPSGFPGEGQPLVLQTQQLICVTRETRRVPEEFIRWPSKPRVLFAYASPPTFEEVPAAAHLLALRDALAPWLALSDDLDDDERLEIIGERLSVLPDATVESLERACASSDYTHVHILAHGVDLPGGYDQRYGVALISHTDPKGYEVVSGARLASILRTPRRDKAGKFVRPAVVTLASCNGGNVGGVTGVGASVGHALHEAGIPLVIASQYPLSFGGSVMLVQDLYQGLLWGEDPRKLLVGLRRRLHSCFKDQHDWASIVAYASLPPNFDDQLANACIQQAMSSINIALRASDRVMVAFSDRESSSTGRHQMLADDKRQEMLRHVQRKVAYAKERLEAANEAYPAQRARILAQLASTEKREAQMLFHSRRSASRTTKKGGNEVLDKLERARTWYWQAYLLNRSHPWELVQYVSLTLFLRTSGRLSRSDWGEAKVKPLWFTADSQSRNDAENGSACDRAWAYGNIAELSLIEPWLKDVPLPPEPGTIDKAIKACRSVVELAGPSSFHVFSTRRQILRYLEWFGPMVDPNWFALQELAEQMLDVMPVCEEPEWNY